MTEAGRRLIAAAKEARAKLQNKCQCGYPDTPCDKKKNDWGHECVEANARATK